MFAESGEDEQIIERVEALDVGKAEIVCCIRLPAAGGGRWTMVTSLCELANRLVGLGIERVVMEATSDCWRPPFYLFEAHGLDPWLVNTRFHDLGGDHYDRHVNTHAKKRNHVRQREALGYRVTLEPAA